MVSEIGGSHGKNLSMEQEGPAVVSNEPQGMSWASHSPPQSHSSPSVTWQQ